MNKTYAAYDGQTHSIDANTLVNVLIHYQTVVTEANRQYGCGGERFGKGDAIRVRLRIVQRYNKDYKAYENKAFKITEFYEHIENKQGSLFDNDE